MRGAGVAHDGPDMVCQVIGGELAAELQLAATWLGLERVELAGRGDLSGELAALI